jgi:RimJ/RimL family protein N-acetyltransferase
VDHLPAIVESARLTLRHWTEGDAPALSAVIEASLDHLRPWMPWAALEPSTLEQRRALIRRWDNEWKQGGDSVLGVFHDGAVVGGSGLHQRVGPSGVEIGYWIHVDHIRRGYATEAAGALTRAAFDLAGIDRVEIHHDKANCASSAVAGRLGFILVSERPEEIEAPGEAGIGCRWVVTRARWRGLQRP